VVAAPALVSVKAQAAAANAILASVISDYPSILDDAAKPRRCTMRKATACGKAARRNRLTPQ
jgi:hypothetical protein